jgi:hypothetical protein
MLKTLLTAAALTVASFNLAMAKDVHQHNHIARHEYIGNVQVPATYRDRPHGYGYDHEHLSDGCDEANKAPMTTCSNGG